MQEGDSNKEKLKSSFEDIIKDHLHKLSSMQEISPFISMVMSAFRSESRKKKKEFLEEHGTVVEEEENWKRYQVPVTHTSQMKSINRRQQRVATAYEILPPVFVVSLVSQYDAFLGQLIAEILRIKPELLNASEKNISFSDLQEFSSIEAARESIVEKEVEGVLRKSHSEQFLWLEKKLGVELRKGLDSWPSFVELTERRNLFVHADGLVSTQYLQACKANGVELDEDVVLGVRLEATKEYIRSSYECLFEISSKLTQVIWRKLLPGEMDTADSALVSITYDLLLEKQNRLASNLLSFAVEGLKKWDSEINRRMLVINYAQSYYHRGDKATTNRILEREDWSACSDDFKMCELVLREEYESAFTLMGKLGKGSPFNENHYLEWPVFRQFRKHEEFPREYEKVFGEWPVSHDEIEKKN